MNGFCLDTSAVLDLHFRRYPRRIFTTLWDNLDKLVAEGKLKLAEDVVNELGAVEDDAHKWAKSVAHIALIPLSQAIQERTTLILTAHPNLVKVKKGKPKSQADPFVIATAQEHDLMVVTTEKNSGNPAHPHIPDCCRMIGVPCGDIVQMLDVLGWKL